MASLALMVTLIILVVLLSGPAVYLICLVPFIPGVIKTILCVATVAVGFYWLMMPVGIMRALGLLPIFCGIKALDKRFKPKEEHHEPE